MVAGPAHALRTATSTSSSRTRRPTWHDDCARPASSRPAIRSSTSGSTTFGRSSGPGCRSSSRCTTSRSGSTGSAPPTAELLRTAVPSATGIPGLLALEPARHAVALAVHAWAHVPLGRLGRLVDVAALVAGRRPRRAGARSPAAWDVERLWRTTQATIDSLFGDRRRPLVGHIWARHLWSARERTVLERHLERWLGPFSALPPARAARATRQAPRATSSPWRRARRARR